MADQLHDIVTKMVAAGEPEENIALVIQHYKSAQPPTAPAPPEKPGYLDSGGMFGEGNIINGVIQAGKAALNHPVQTGAIIGGAIAAPFTGGASIPASMAAAGLGAAGGAGIGSIVDQFRHGPDTPAHVAEQMATEGALGAAGEGAGQGVARLAKGAGKLVYKTALRPSMGLQREFGDVAATGLREGATVSEGGVRRTAQGIEDSSAEVKRLLAAKDAERPVVAGYLPPAREAVPLGAAPVPGAMPTRVVGAQRLPLRRPPIGNTGRRYAEHIEGVDPVEDLFASALDETGHPIPTTLESPPLAGPGVMYRPMQSPAGIGAHGSMIDAREIAQRGLGGARAELSDRALAGDATDQLASLEQRFIDQRGSRPMTLTEAQRMKQAEQGLADTAYRAEQMGGPVNGIESRFHQGIARGTREAIEQRVPEVAGHNAHTQELIGLTRALEDATRRNVPGVGSLRSLLGDFMPATASGAGIGLDRVGGSPLTSGAVRSALLALFGGQ